MSEIRTQVQFVEIDSDMAGQRIDNFLRNQLKALPKSMVYRIVRKGEVRVNKKRVKAEYKLQAGDLVRIPPVTIPQEEENPGLSTKLNKVAELEDCIIFEDEHMLILNKPSGTAVHGGSGLKFGAIEALRALRLSLVSLSLCTVSTVIHQVSCWLLKSAQPFVIFKRSSERRQYRSITLLS